MNDMEEWIAKINEDVNVMKVRDEEFAKFQTLSEGSHLIKIDLSTKDSVVIEKKNIGSVKYTIFKTIDFEKPYLKLTGYQYGLLLSKVSKIPGYPDIPKEVMVVANVTRGANDKLYFDISIATGDSDDQTE